MPQSNDTQQGIPITALSLAIGLVLGGLVGLIAGNVILFAGGGLVLGLAIGYALDRRSQGNTVS